MLPPELQGWEPKSRGYKQAATNWNYEETAAAHFWRLTPWEFDARAQEEKAKMIAYRIASSLLDAWSYEQAEKAAQSESSSSRGARR